MANRKTTKRKSPAKPAQASTKAAAPTKAKPASPSTKAKAAKPRPAPEVVLKITHDEIAQRAYLIWLANGKPTGEEEFNWHQAERELLHKTAA